MVSALRLVTPCVEYNNDRVFPFLWDFSLAPTEGRTSVKLQQDGPVLLKSTFRSYTGRPPGHTASTFVLASIAVAISSSVGSIPRTLTTGCYGGLFSMPGSSMSDFAFSSEGKHRTHLSWIRLLSSRSLPSSSRTYYDSNVFVSSSCIDLIFWKDPC